jgi:hypothetical protein
MLYQLVTGVPPFIGNTSWELYQNILKGEYSTSHEAFGLITDPVTFILLE